MGASLNRRTMLGAVVAGGAVLPAVAQPAPDMAAGVTPAFAALLAEADRRDAVSDRYSREVYEPALALADKLRADVPHIEVMTRYQAIGGTSERMLSTADNVAVKRALSAAGRGPCYLDGAGPDASAYHRSLCRLAAAHKWRERKLRRIRDATGLSAAYDQSTAYDEHYLEAHEAVLAFPVATLPDLVAMTWFLEDHGEENSDVLTAGIRRLAGEAVA